MSNRTNKNLTGTERHAIETLYKAGHSPKEIAVLLKRGYSTICRELKRGLCICVTSELIPYVTYGADKAISNAIDKGHNRTHDIKLGKDYNLCSFIESQFDGKTSPAVIAKRIENNKHKFSVTVSKNTIYDWLNKGYINVSKKKLPMKRKKRKKSISSAKVNIKNATKRSIERRNDEINARITFGHWELDSVVGKRDGKSTSLLVFTERLTRFELIFRIDCRKSIYVQKALKTLQKKLQGSFSDIFKTITVDNGSEFSSSSDLEKETKTLVYYCHPFSSWERGSNENQNRLIRRHIPKGKSMVNVTHKKVLEIQNWMNNYERKILNWQTPKQRFLEELEKANIYNSYFV